MQNPALANAQFTGQQPITLRQPKTQGRSNTMEDALSLEVQARDPEGSNSARRLRRLEDRVPGVLYGAGREPASFSLESRVLVKAMESEAFFSQIIELVMGARRQRVVLRDVQRHPATDRVIHIDFLRIQEDQVMHMAVPIHFLNEDRCQGVKVDGGIIARNLIEVEVACLPKDLPQYIECDLGELRVGHSVHLSDLELPERVRAVALMHGSEHDTSVVSVQPPRGGLEQETDEAVDDDQVDVEGAADSPDEQ